MTNTDDRWLNVAELRVSAEHNLTDSRTRAQLFWAADRIAELEATIAHQNETLLMQAQRIEQDRRRIAELEAELILPTDDHVIAIDVFCSCGASAKGLWSGEDADDWHEQHQKECSDD